MPLSLSLPTAHTPLIIGTRGSPLALAQAKNLVRALCQEHGLETAACSILPITTRGDTDTRTPFAALGGGKGLFTRELDEALLAGRIDIAVHSAKDLPAILPSGIVCRHCLPREDVRDALVSYSARRLLDLPHGAVVGSSSVRRRAQIKRTRADLRVIEFRGNVDTRLNKLWSGQAQATLLALAGLMRLGISEQLPCTPVSLDDALPALAQGAIAVTHRQGNTRCADLLDAIHHRPTGYAVTCERACLCALQADCSVPLAGLAKVTGNGIALTLELLHPTDGRTIARVNLDGDCQDAFDIGDSAGQQVRTAAETDGLLQAGQWRI